VTAKVDGIEVAAGNDKLMRHLNIPYQDCHQTGTIIHMAIGGKYAIRCLFVKNLSKPF
jgi:Cd2+/Zn2+-exporting ATPase